jgi:ABC-type sulfate transport system substrate-binding protein
MFICCVTILLKRATKLLVFFHLLYTHFSNMCMPVTTKTYLSLAELHLCSYHFTSAHYKRINNASNRELKAKSNHKWHDVQTSFDKSGSLI